MPEELYQPRCLLCHEPFVEMPPPPVALRHEIPSLNFGSEYSLPYINVEIPSTFSRSRRRHASARIDACKSSVLISVLRVRNLSLQRGANSLWMVTMREQLTRLEDAFHLLDLDTYDGFTDFRDGADTTSSSE